MGDVFSRAKRSEVMGRIRGRGNKDTEVRLLRLLREGRITGWRRHQNLPGRPDFAFRRERVAVFVDGCFWHGCSVHYNAPMNNSAFWRAKLLANRRRDKLVNSLLRRQGWKVLRLWEHELAEGRPAIRRVRAALKPRTL